MDTMTGEAQRAAARFRSGLERIYGDRLVGVYVFGSQARGDFGAESDLDVLVVLDCVDRYAEEIERTGRLTSALSLEYGIPISRVFVSEEAWLEGDTAFLHKTREEAVPA